MDAPILLSWAAAWFTLGVLTGRHVVPWLVDRWLDRRGDGW